MKVIELNAVSKSYGGRELFADVSWTVEAGRVYGLAGPNGSGKSVLFRIMTGFVRPDSGAVAINPVFMDGGRVFPKGFGIVIDRPGYLAHKTGLENLLALARIRRVVAEREVRAAMAALGLDPESKTRVGRYSLGMKQKLSIIQATMEGQRVLVLDEPFNALDRSSVETVRNLLRAHRDGGGTVVFTSHNAQDLDLLADEVHEIDRGTLVRR
ncbi:MAG: ABC transporter ATP-binding protein [Bifidobacteriaceae bacterium]|jgi:ABC-2 type transport system ATP-binding protein|nr:ABC transporter ATP-binding protein [Bifidobacteriaceae bacterium]